MRLKKHLNEAALMVGFKDLPVWVKKVLADRKIRRDIKVNTGSKIKIPGNWHDANVRRIHAFRNGKISSRIAIGGQAMHDTPEDTVAKKGFDVELKPGDMILVINSYPKGAELYAHPMDMKPLLDEPASDELSRDEIITLFIIKQTKAAFRARSAREEGIKNFPEIKASLMKKGFLMKNGAINKKGKNFIINFQGKHGKNYMQVYDVKAVLDK